MLLSITAGLNLTRCFYPLQLVSIKLDDFIHYSWTQLNQVFLSITAGLNYTRCFYPLQPDSIKLNALSITAGLN